MSNSNDENSNQQSVKVIQLGFNISVSGDPDTDFQILVDDKLQGTKQASQNKNEMLSLDPCHLQKEPNNEISRHDKLKEVSSAEPSEINLKCNPSLDLTSTSGSNKSLPDVFDSYGSKEYGLISDIKSTMQHFEQFSDHLKEVQRFKSSPLASSSPFVKKENSKSEPSLLYSERRRQKFFHYYDYTTDQETVKPLPSDLFLKPLPGEKLYKTGMIRRYWEHKPSRVYGSIDSLPQSTLYKKPNSWDSNYEIEKFEDTSDRPISILKKSDSESGEKHSTSSAESIKDIKIYQSGGILIMQNFKDDLNTDEKKRMSDFSSKLIDNCNKLRKEKGGHYLGKIDKTSPEKSLEETKPAGKMVHFNLQEEKYQKIKLDSGAISPCNHESFRKTDLNMITPESLKNKEMSKYISHGQDFPSVSTQENDSITSNPLGISPVTSSKKLEWDSGADVGYLNLDLSKENLSTIERIVLKGLTSDETAKNVCEKKIGHPKYDCSKYLIKKKISKDINNDDYEIIFEDQKSERQSENSIKNDLEENMKNKLEHIVKNKKHIIHQTSESKKEIKKTAILSKDTPKREANNTEMSYEEVRNHKKFHKPVILLSKDKSVNVNTLFPENINSESTAFSMYNNSSKLFEPQPKFSSSKILGKTKKLKLKSYNQRFNSIVSLKDKSQLLIECMRQNKKIQNSKATPLRMKIKKRKIKKRKLKIIELERSRDMEEIVIDQKFKTNTKQTLENESLDKIPSVELREKSTINSRQQDLLNRPISGSSSSNKTILSNCNKKKKTKCTDQVVQTKDLQTESSKVQAFPCLKNNIFYTPNSSALNKKLVQSTKSIGNVRYKNIQAFGINSSLPKHLAHPKESNLVEASNEKSTQYFGGPVNSLPNYHPQVLKKQFESCEHVLEILNEKKNVETEMVNSGEAKRNCNVYIKGEKNDCTKEKENALSETLKNSEKRAPSVETSNCTKAHQLPSRTEEKCTSDLKTKTENEADNNLEKVGTLTSDALERHCSGIDKNLLQEKYFLSQMYEIGKKEMISKSTSIENINIIEEDYLESQKNVATVACQYSAHSSETLSNGESNFARFCDPADSKLETVPTKETFYCYDSSQNLGNEEYLGISKETNQDPDIETGESFPSSTQTAHSWILGMQKDNKNVESVIRKARSFEYLPGHIYESSGNLIEKLPSDIEQNIITGSSSDDVSQEELTKQSLSDQGKNSEGRDTLVLENSNDVSLESSPLKTLDENLSLLNIVVTRLREKDDRIHKITQSLLIDFCRRNGCGDGDIVLTDTLRTKTIEQENYSSNEERKTENLDALQTENYFKAKKDISVACQTDDKSCDSSLKKYNEEKKALAKKITTDKESQIKWIEKEICHLNILRGLLEKENTSNSKRKQRSNLTLLSVDSSPSKCEESCSEGYSKIQGEIVPQTHFSNNEILEKGQNTSLEKEALKSFQSGSTDLNNKNRAKYGMAVSLKGSLRKVVLLPVNVQVSLKDPDSTKECEENFNHENFPSPFYYSSPDRLHIDSTKSWRHNKPLQCDATMQCPSIKRKTQNNPSMSVQADITSPQQCNYCNQENCVCLSLSQTEKSDVTSSKSSRKTHDKKGSLKLCVNSDEPVRMSIETNVQSGSSVDIRSKTNEKSDDLYKVMIDSNTVSTKNDCSLACKCENCPEGNSHNFDKLKRICQNKFRSTNSSNYEKPSGTCHCEFEISRPQECSCSAIKFHQMKHCIVESTKCKKATENQCCQTNEVIEMKEAVMNQNLVISKKCPEIACPKEAKVGLEIRSPVDKRYPCNLKLPYEVQQSEVDETGKIIYKSSYNVSKPPNTCMCCCKKKNKQERLIVDDHPRHYFLKIEETEIDDVNESTERRKSLEVITVKVPVKKNTNIQKAHKNKFKSSSASRKTSVKEKTKPSGCNCCADCLGRICQKVTQECENRMKEEVRKMKMEKPRTYEKLNLNGNKAKDCVQSYSSNNVGKKSEGIDSFEKICGEENVFEKLDKNCISLQSYESGIKKREKLSSSVFTPENYKVYEIPVKSNSDDYKKVLTNNNFCDKVYHPYSSPVVHSKDNNVGCFNKKSDYSLLCETNYESSQSKLYPTETSSDYDSHREWKTSSSECFCENSKNIYNNKENYQACYISEKDLGESSTSGPLKFRTSDGNSNNYDCDYYNYDKKGNMTKSELLKEKQMAAQRHYPSLQECLESNRPDFCSSAESRRRFITEKAKNRIEKHKNRMECLINLIHHCSKNDYSQNSKGPKQMFTTPQMKKQTMKKYKQLAEVTEKVANEKKKNEYRTNKLMADIFAKKLQLEALKGHVNLSNSVSVLSTI